MNFFRALKFHFVSFLTKNFHSGVGPISVGLSSKLSPGFALLTTFHQLCWYYLQLKYFQVFGFLHLYLNRYFIGNRSRILFKSHLFYNFSNSKHFILKGVKNFSVIYLFGRTSQKRTVAKSSGTACTTW